MVSASPVATPELELAPASDVHEAPGASDFGVSALGTALGAVGDRWSLAVVAQLTSGPQRFNDLAGALAPIARTVLSDRLRKLEEAGVIAKRQYSSAPVRCNYRLTASGEELARACGVLADWASRHVLEGEASLLHRGCSGTIVSAWHCETCGPVPLGEVLDTTLPRS